MMKKLIVGLLAVAAVVALRPVVKRRVVEMHEHCRQMMSDFAGGSEATGREAADAEAMRQMMREHCGQMAPQEEERSEAVAVA